MTTASNFADREHIAATYHDPLELIWIHAANAMGMRIERDPTVFASWDGQGTLRIGVPESLDADDCLAQMILHEVCHALVEGPDAVHRPDWGLRIDDPTQRVREHACLRLQAALTTPYGLRTFFAATTVFRKYYDRLPDNPLAGGEDPAIAPALAGWTRFQSGPWNASLQQALAATAQIAATVRSAAPADSLWATVTAQ